MKLRLVTLSSDNDQNVAVATRKSWCGQCGGRGYWRDDESKRVYPCGCGRTPNDAGRRALAKQDKLDKRLEELQTKGW